MDLLTYIRNQWDRVIAWLCLGAGGLALVAGWIGMSGTPYPAKQLPYLVSGGLAGIFLLGLGALLWLTAYLRDEWQEIHSLGEQLGVLTTPEDLTVGQASAPAAATVRVP